MLLPNPHPDPVRRVPLFARGLQIALQIPSMNSRTGSSFGLLLAGALRSGGIGLASACRTLRRWVFNFFATPWIMPTPNRYSRRISSNSSTLRLLSIGPPSIPLTG